MQGYHLAALRTLTFEEHITVCLKMGGKGLKTVSLGDVSISVQNPEVGIGAETLRKGRVGGQRWPVRGPGRLKI